MTDGVNVRARAGEALGQPLQRHLREFRDGTNDDPLTRD